MTIGIIGAMEQEVSLLRSQIENLTTTSDAGIEFYQGRLAGRDVVLIRSGIGKVAAAICTTLLMERFQPSQVINIGSAGGFDPSLNVGDVVISSEVRHHDADVTAFGYVPGQLPGLPEAFIPHPDLVDIAQRSLDKVGHVRTVQGLICSGDTFMADPQRVEKTRAVFPQMAAVEMEAAAVAQVCHQFEVPFVIIRALSDIAGKDSSTSFDAFLEEAAKHSSEVVLEMLRQLDA